MKIIDKNVNPLGMSYWRNINNHKNSDELKVILSKNDVLALYTINKSTLEVVSETSLNINHTGEGCFFSAIDKDKLFIPFDNYLATLNISTGEINKVWESSNKLWQMHSSINENAFSATLKDDNYNIIGWAVYRNGIEERFTLKGEPDECQIDKSGKWLLIKEDNYNRIIDLNTKSERIITDEKGAVGHSDNGYGFTLGENDKSNLPGALDKIDFSTNEHSNMYSTGIWNMGYVSIQNDKILLTTPYSLILVNEGRKICDHLSESNLYEHRPKANLCPLGEFAVFTSFISRELNAYIVRI